VSRLHGGESCSRRECGPPQTGHSNRTTTVASDLEPPSAQRDEAVEYQGKRLQAVIDAHVAELQRRADMTERVATLAAHESQ
jgi:hypothetical protein